MKRILRILYLLSFVPLLLATQCTNPRVIVAVNPSALEITAGSAKTATVTVTRVDFSGQVSLSMNGQPAGVTWACIPNPIPDSQTTSQLTITVPAGTPAATSSIEVRGSHPSAQDGAATLTLKVLGPEIRTITVTPDPGSVQITKTITFTAVARDASNNPVAGVTFTWASSDPTKATIDASSGVATGVALGTTNITASAGGITSAPIVLTVTPPLSLLGTWDVTTWDNCIWGD